MKKNILKYGGIFFASIVINLLVIYGLFSNPTTARLFIGAVTITDTLSGNAKFNHGVYTMGEIHGDVVRASGGISFSSIDRFIDDDGNDLTINVGSGGEIKFYQNTKVPLKINSSANVEFDFNTDDLILIDATQSGTLSNMSGYITVTVGGSTKYIPVYDN